MSLIIPLAQLAQQEVRFEGSLGAAELGAGIDTQGDLVRLDAPLEYRLTVRRMGSSLLAEGTLDTEVGCQCARCLAPFRRAVRLDPWSVVLPLEGEEAVPVVQDAVDLTPYVREDTLLALPQHPLCDPECRGLSSKPSTEVKDPDTADSPEGDVSAWAVLDRLKL